MFYQNEINQNLNIFGWSAEKTLLILHEIVITKYTYEQNRLNKIAFVYYMK